ncbi:MAG: alpha-glucosidase/alpha-galactosidase [Clostridia bacterium]|jgi:alpha-galactosidase|nr:alpha-glucosidase/alpha-galactosidase [Clostridiaceae bacterium]
MRKITFIGAGSTVFAKNVLGDIVLTPELKGSELALYDIDPVRLDDSYRMMKNINANYGEPMIIKAYSDSREAFKGASYLVNAIQVGGYDPCTIIDFEIPKKYGLRQTIGDTLGIGGIFRALRTIPVMLDYARLIEEVCPDAWLLNYTNPMAMVTGAILRGSNVKTVGLCHSVQVCASSLLHTLKMADRYQKVVQKVAGINHMAWLLEVKGDGRDIYPEIKARFAELEASGELKNSGNLVRLEIMKRFGYYLTESGEHDAEYVPYFIKSKYPELIERFNIPLDEYPRRCINQINRWESMRKDLVENTKIEHRLTHEYAANIIKALATDTHYEIAGNVINNGMITNLPSNACVEVPCLVNGYGIHPCFVGDLPEQCAALNRTNINVQNLTIEAALTLKKEYVYHAALLDPHTSAELSIDDIISLCDDLFEAHKDWLPEYK